MRVRLPSSGTFGALSAWSSFDTLLQRLDITTDPNFWDGLQSLIPYQDYFLESQYHDLQEGCEASETQQGPNKTQTPNPPNTPNPECLCANSPFYAYEIHGIECTEYRLLYWYHPDYLGHNEFITDNSGLPYQYFHYSAISRRDFERKPKRRSAMLAQPSPAFRRGGETLVEDNAHYGQFSSPYRFNAKELDGETGNYYYGASSRRDFEHKPKGRSATLARPSPAFWRGYYNPTWSVWLSVDAMASKGLNITPYAFSHNNPIMLVDPDGNWPNPVIYALLRVKYEIWKNNLAGSTRRLAAGTSGEIPPNVPVPQETINLVEGAGAVIGSIPGIETAADGVGLFYNLVKGDVDGVATYSLALALSGISVNIVKLGKGGYQPANQLLRKSSDGKLPVPVSLSGELNKGFTKLKGKQGYIHDRTGAIYKKSYTTHRSETEVQWKAYPKGTEDYSKDTGDRITIDGDGTIIGD